MNYHIVRTNEKIDKIILFYHLTQDEIVKLNPQIKNWDKLTPGMKLRIPAISENLSNELDEIEPFIEDYYPKIDITKFTEEKMEVNHDVQEPPQVIIESNDEDNLSMTTDKEELIVKESDDEHIVKKVNSQPYQPYSFVLPPQYTYNPYQSYMQQAIMHHRNARKKRNKGHN